MVLHVHMPWCTFLQANERFKQGTLPRSFFKTYTGTVGYSIWRALQNPNITILIAMNTLDNAKSKVGLIRQQFESNALLRKLFPEIVPDFSKVPWSNQAACINRTDSKDMQTFESIGVGGAVTSRHYDLIIEDDLVYAKKDDLTGAEIRPNPEDIQKAIGWHKLVYSLMADPQKSEIVNIGTRWSVHDLIDWIRTSEPHFKVFEMSALTPEGVPIWPERFGEKELKLIRASQGNYMFSTQYLNMPINPADRLFHHEWLRPYSTPPEHLEIKTIVDLAGWGDKKGLAQTVVFTAGKDQHNHIWILAYDRGRYNPTQLLEIMERHALRYKSTVYIEEVNYQAAIRHFAKERMEQTGKVYSIVALPFQQGRDAKEVRIRSIEPFGQNGMIHYRINMLAFVNEWDDYPSTPTVDLLDCLGFFLHVSRAMITEVGDISTTGYFGDFTLEKILESCEKGRHKSASGQYNYTDVIDPFKTGLDSLLDSIL